MKQEESKSAHAHKKTYTNVIMNKTRKERDEINLFFFRLFDGLYIYIYMAIAFFLFFGRLCNC